VLTPFVTLIVGVIVR